MKASIVARTQVCPDQRSSLGFDRCTRLPRCTPLRTPLPKLLCVALLSLAGCAGDGSGLDAAADVGSAVIDDVGTGDASGADLGAEPCRSYAPGADSDGDGLPDRLEDADLDCIVDPDETDPASADTDGDGLPDGVEDVDRDGRWDEAQGELDPKVFDTDGDGRSDAEDVLATVCTSALVDALWDDRMVEDTGIHGLPGWSQRLSGPDDVTWSWHDDGAVARTARSLPDVDVVASATSRALATGWAVSERVVSSDRVWLTVETPVPVTVERVLEVLSGDEDAPQSAGTQASTQFSALISHGSDSRAGDRSVIAAAGWESTVASAALALLTWRNVPPDTQARPRAYCERLPLVPATTRGLRVVWVMDTTQRASVNETPVWGAIDALLTRGAAEGDPVELWMLAGDAHLTMAPGAPLHAAPLDSVEEARAVWQAAPVGMPDQRLLANGLAFLEQQAAFAVPRPTLVVFDGAREDAEFREGIFMGRDGDPFAEPLEQNAARQQRVAHYATQLANLDVVVAATGPGSAGPTSPCAGSSTDPRPLRTDSARAIREVAVELRGIFFERCGADAEAMAALLTSLAVPPRHAALDRVPIPGTLRVSLSSGEAVDPSSWGWNADATRVGWTTGDGPLGTGYLYWE